ncbi:ATP-dependent DNA helicase [Fusarium oxysporum f. sp. albedinis]|nr:ATP-dependent DNA helicase [Fusarium oxysporum f. sp. albedinis]
MEGLETIYGAGPRRTVELGNIPALPQNVGQSRPRSAWKIKYSVIVQPRDDNGGNNLGLRVDVTRVSNVPFVTVVRWPTFTCCIAGEAYNSSQVRVHTTSSQFLPYGNHRLSRVLFHQRKPCLVSTISNMNNEVIRPVMIGHFGLRTTPERFEAMIKWHVDFFGGRVVLKNEKAAFIAYDDEHHRLVIVQDPGHAVIRTNTPPLESIILPLLSTAWLIW